VKFSIVTPSYNHGEFLERTLQSVSGQAGVAAEHVIVDACSTDDTAAILARYGHGIRWVSEPDKGQTEAVNKGIRATDGEIIGWLNSDDIYYPGALARVAEVFERDPGVDVVYGLADHIDVNDQPFEAYPVESWDPVRLMETCFISQPAAFFRRSVVSRYGLLDESLQYCMDYEYWLRLARAGARFAHQPEKLAGSRLYPDNKTMRASVAVHREINDMFRRKFHEVPDGWLYKYANVVVRERLNERADPVRFARQASLHTLLASLRWNRRITRALLARHFPDWFSARL